MSLSKKTILILVCFTALLAGTAKCMDDIYNPFDDPIGGSDPFGINDDGGDWFWEGLNDWDRDIGIEKEEPCNDACLDDEKCVMGKCVKICKLPSIFDPKTGQCASSWKGSCETKKCLSFTGLKCDENSKRCLCPKYHFWDYTKKTCVARRLYKYYALYLNLVNAQWKE